MLMFGAAVLGARATSAQTSDAPGGNVIMITLYEPGPHALPGTPGSLDTSFSGAWVGRGARVRTVAVQPDGKALVVGDFSRINGAVRHGIARLNADGSLDEGFDPGSKAKGEIKSVVVQEADKLLIRGDFTNFDGMSCHGFARLHADGSLDPNFLFDAAAYTEIHCVVVQPDGKILLAGSRTRSDGGTDRVLTRLNADGSLDTGFHAGDGPDFYVLTMAVQPDGKVVIVGSFVAHDTRSSGKVARLNTDGSLDTSFDAGYGVSLFISSVVVQEDGKIIVAGEFESYNDKPCHGIARLNPDGSLDTSFAQRQAGTWQEITSMVLQADGKVLVGGFFEYLGNILRPGVARLNADGSMDESFDIGAGTSGVCAVAALPEGRVLVGGEFISYNGSRCAGLARVDPDGKMDFTSKPAIATQVGTVNCIVVQSDGKAILGGRFVSVNGTACSGIARLNSDGTLDADFNAGGRGVNGKVSTTALQPDGSVYIGGQFTSCNDVARDHLARLTAKGSLVPDFDPQLGIYKDDDVHAVLIQPDGKILVGGQLFYVKGTSAHHLTRLNPDGNVDTSFQIPAGTDMQPSSVVLQPDGKILADGYSVEDDKTERRGIMRLNADGSLDTGFGVGSKMDGIIYSAALQPDGRIIIGGSFALGTGTGRHNVACLNAGGNLDDKSNSGAGADNDVFSVAVQPDGKPLLVGQFNGVNGISRGRIARLNTDGSLDASFYPGVGTGGIIYAVALQPDGKLLLGGEFSEYDGVDTGGIARLNGDPVTVAPAPAPPTNDPNNSGEQPPQK